MMSSGASSRPSPLGLTIPAPAQQSGSLVSSQHSASPGFPGLPPPDPNPK